MCAMWLTGFDVKTLSCLYLDKPLKAHTLMQTIARANRVAAGKSNGLIIDYVGIVRALKKALNDYTQNKGGTAGVDPTVEKDVLLQHINLAIAEADQLLRDHEFSLQKQIDATGFEKLSLVKDGADAMLCDAETNALIGAVLVGPEVSELLPELSLAAAHNMTAADIALHASFVAKDSRNILI